MQHKQGQLPEEMYHRIYRLYKRNWPTDVIAATLQIPVRSVQNVMERFSAGGQNAAASKSTQEGGKKTAASPSSFLDAYIFSKSAYAVLDLNGMIIESHIHILEQQFAEILQSTWRCVAIKMSGVRKIDETGAGALRAFHKKFIDKGYFCALLDPSAEVENALKQYELEGTIPVFGTDFAFEEAALRRKESITEKKR